MVPSLCLFVTTKIKPDSVQSERVIKFGYWTTHEQNDSNSSSFLLASHLLFFLKLLFWDWYYLIDYFSLIKFILIKAKPNSLVSEFSPTDTGFVGLSISKRTL